MAAKLSAPDQLELEQKERILVWVGQRYPFFSKGQLRDEWEKCRDWHLMHNERRANWEAAFRNWLRKAADFSSRDHQGARPASRTSARSSAVPPGDLEPLGPLLRKLL